MVMIDDGPVDLSEIVLYRTNDLILISSFKLRSSIMNTHSDINLSDILDIRHAHCSANDAVLRVNLMSNRSARVSSRTKIQS